jgi:hypothetical protein
MDNDVFRWQGAEALSDPNSLISNTSRPDRTADDRNLTQLSTSSSSRTPANRLI